MNNQMEIEVEQGTTLAQFLETLPDDVKIYIGSKVAYMLIGNKEFIRENCYSVFNEYRLGQLELLREYNEFIQNHLESGCYLRTKTDMRSYTTEEGRKRIYGELKVEMRKLEAVRLKLSAIASCQNYIADFVPPFAREVKQAYTKLDDGIAIIIEGTEKGPYWFEDDQWEV